MTHCALLLISGIENQGRIRESGEIDTLLVQGNLYPKPFDVTALQSYVCNQGSHEGSLRVVTWYSAELT